MSNEVWKDIPGFEGEYMVSSYGRVKLLARAGRRSDQDKILEPRTANTGGLFVGLRHVGNRKVHNLSISATVGKVFLENPNGYRMVVHKDGDITNNNVTNLEYVSPRALLGKAVSKKHGKPVKCLDTGVVYPCIIEASRDNHVSANTLVTAIESSTDVHGRMFVYADRSEVDYDSWY